MRCRSCIAHNRYSILAPCSLLQVHVDAAETMFVELRIAQVLAAVVV